MRSIGNSIWTDDVVAELKKLWGDGYTCSQIAAEMGRGLTRNAVIGKVTRLKLTRRYWGNGYSRIINPIPADTPRSRPVFKSREREIRRLKDQPPPKIITAVSPRTGAFINFKKHPLKHNLTKNEMRAMLTLAVQNTAAMEVLQ